MATFSFISIIFGACEYVKLLLFFALLLKLMHANWTEFGPGVYCAGIFEDRKAEKESDVFSIEEVCH